MITARRGAGGFDAARTLVAADRGKAAMDAIRADVAAMEEYERDVRARRVAEMESAYRVAVGAAS